MVVPLPISHKATPWINRFLYSFGNKCTFKSCNSTPIYYLYPLMNRKRIGIWVSRRSAVLVGLSNDGRSLALCQKTIRTLDESVVNVLEKLLLQIPAEWRSSEIRIALSPCDLACCDCFDVPFRSESQVESTIASIIESRCAGECAEELAMDIRRIVKTPTGSRIQAVAIRQPILSAIRTVLRKSLPHAELKLVTGASAVLAQAILAKPATGPFVLAVSESREAHIICTDQHGVLGWRAFAFDFSSPDFAQRLQIEAAQFGTGEVTVYCSQDVCLFGKMSVDPALAVATAVALVEPKEIVDLLKGADDAPKSSTERLRIPLIAACVAIIAFCVSVAIYFHLQAVALERAIADAESVERKLGQEYLHGELPDADGLTTQMNKKLAEHLKRLNANHQPSVLAFWSEIAQALPSPERIGLVTDSLQLGHEEGRLIGRVSRGQEDALKNASLLETNLNRSGQLTAHGEFETKESEILFRLRMNFHPRSEHTETAEAKP